MFFVPEIKFIRRRCHGNHVYSLNQTLNNHFNLCKRQNLFVIKWNIFVNFWVVHGMFVFFLFRLISRSFLFFRYFRLFCVLFWDVKLCFVLKYPFFSRCFTTNTAEMVETTWILRSGFPWNSLYKRRFLIRFVVCFTNNNLYQFLIGIWYWSDMYKKSDRFFTEGGFKKNVSGFKKPLPIYNEMRI